MNLETKFSSGEAVGRKTSYRPGTLLPSSTAVPQFFSKSLTGVQLSGDGGETRRVGQSYQRHDGQTWREVR